MDHAFPVRQRSAVVALTHDGSSDETTDSSPYESSNTSDDLLPDGVEIIAPLSPRTFMKEPFIFSPLAQPFVPARLARMTRLPTITVRRVTMRRLESSRPVSGIEPTQPWLIVPIGVPGCGKTGICAALAYLFGFGHVQSGDIFDNKRKKGQAAPFLKAVAASLRTNEVVLVDRNNHQRYHRADLRDLCSDDSSLAPAKPKILALHWTLTLPSRDKVHACLRQRILGWRKAQHWFIPRRGDSLKSVLWKFIYEAEPIEKDEADFVVEMDPLEKLETALMRAVLGVVEALGLEAPNEMAMHAAVRVARMYHPRTRR